MDDKAFVATVAFGWLAFITIANIRGMGVGKWINNIGGVGSVVTVGLVALAAAVARAHGHGRDAAPGHGHAARHGGGLGVMCFAFIGIELASTMADEIRNPERDIPRPS